MPCCPSCVRATATLRACIRWGRRLQESLQASRETMAKYLGCDAREITFTSGGSEADNQALLTAATLGGAQGQKAHHLHRL